MKVNSYDPLAQLVQEAESWFEFAKTHEVSDDMLWWAGKILIARDKQRKFARQALELLEEEHATAQLCASEMICQRCEQEPNSLPANCPCLCHERV